MPGPAPPEKKPWTVLAYIVADHKDTRTADKDTVAPRIDEVAFEEVTNLLWSADRSKANVAVQLDFTRLSGVFRVLANSNGVTKTLLPEERGAGSVDTFTDYIAAVARECPAEHYLLLIWGHGEGPIGFFADDHGGDLLRAADKTLSLPELASVLEYAASADGFGQKVDILLGKSCSLATIEAAYELKDGVDLMLCSQAIVPLRAWDYDGIFKALDSDVERTARGLLDALDRQFAEDEARMGRAEVPYSIIRPAMMAGLAAVIKPLAAALSATPASLLQAPLLDAIAAARRPSCDAALLDLGALCAALALLPDWGEDGPAARLKAFLESEDRPVIEHRPRNTLFHGISAFYLPPPELRRFSFGGDVTTFAYRRLGVAAATGWDQVAFTVDGAAT